MWWGVPKRRRPCPALIQADTIVQPPRKKSTLPSYALTIQVAMSVSSYLCWGRWGRLDGLSGWGLRYSEAAAIKSRHCSSRACIKTRLLVRLLKPLTDAMARLEKLSASLDQTFISIITSYRQVQQAEIDPDWRVAVLSAISAVGKRFSLPAYFVTLFLNPQRQTMAISRKYNAESTTKEALTLTKNFGFSKNQRIQIKSDIADYLTWVQARGKWDDPIDLWGWWNQQLKCQQLRLLALMLLSVPQHTATVKRLFSSLDLAKTKPRNQSE